MPTVIPTRVNMHTSNICKKVPLHYYYGKLYVTGTYKVPYHWSELKCSSVQYRYLKLSNTSRITRDITKNLDKSREKPCR